MNFSKSIGEVPATIAPNFSSRFFTVGEWGASTAFLEILEVNSDDRPAGASIPHHTTASYPETPASAIVGTSGRTGERVAEVTPRGRNFPIIGEKESAKN